MTSSTRSHDQEHGHSYRNLALAREKHAIKAKYDSIETRARLCSIFRTRFGADPHEWQLDVTEAILLGLDCIVIAGTGAGKTMPFMMPLLLDDIKKAVIISPLKVLQEDQARRFQKMELSAVAVNGDTWNAGLEKDLKEGRHRGILTSPEMYLKHDPFREVLTGSNFRDISSLIVDEAHCISQWGGDFRTAYSEIGKLRAFFPSHIPVLATSATLTPMALQEVRSQLGIDPDNSFFLNLGNDRPNIAYSALYMESATDYEALRPHLTSSETPTQPEDLVKSIVFVNSVNQAQQTARALRW
ncbi:P-loop containing nucleoside triphosphate hydrolase protein [Gymnopilus junonius]|uniref:P-loop containing nucleoside triphosphate hydrolase protein n=1 Tax=Gymnopilus junonius TaxID=109634 RepID=A0A9P5N9G4_GYMJU|nr:P-loop containing nucleoside triphosphate hydrolase protein [Gymnopilus junonius]